MTRFPFHRSAARAAPRRRQAGLTLVELMVAMALGLVVAIASVAALVIARQGFTVVDSGSQLRENARFAAGLIQRVGIQAGFENSAGGPSSDWKMFCRDAEPLCNTADGDNNPGIRGYDNAIAGSPFTLGGLAHANRSSGCGSVSDTSCLNGSDILMVRYWGDGRVVGTADGSMINCAGMGEPEGAVPAYSVFHVVRSSAGEPTLACSYRTTAGVWQTVPLVQGVESMQVLYGVDNVTPATAPASQATGTDSVADRYLRASQLDVAGNLPASLDNWRRVRSVRIGLLIRGAPGSAVDRAASGRAYDVLGADFTDGADVGSQLTVAADGRLRQNIVFTVHLRNPQFTIPSVWN